MTQKLLTAAALVLALGASSASAATFDFTGPLLPLGGTDLGNSASFNDTTATYSLTATALNTAISPLPDVNQNVAGLGVKSGTLDIGQLDNIGLNEALVFDFGTSASLTSITLSLASSFDDYRIFGSNDGSVASCNTAACVNGVSSLLASGQGVGIEGTVNVGLSGTYRYLIASTKDSAPFRADGYRVAGLDVAPVPLPAAGLMLVAGLGGLAAARRRRKS